MTNYFDLGVFLSYLVVTLWLGLWVARRKGSGTRGYFLAGERLPWYAIGGSIIAANISTEHFIGMVGIAYATGFVVAQWEWGNWITFSALIWIFLPYYLRGGIVVAVIGLQRVGGIDALMHAAPQKFKFIYPSTDPDYPWFRPVWEGSLSRRSPAA